MLVNENILIPKGSEFEEDFNFLEFHVNLEVAWGRHPKIRFLVNVSQYNIEMSRINCDMPSPHFNLDAPLTLTGAHVILILVVPRKGNTAEKRNLLCEVFLALGRCFPTDALIEEKCKVTIDDIH